MTEPFQPQSTQAQNPALILDSTRPVQLGELIAGPEWIQMGSRHFPIGGTSWRVIDSGVMQSKTPDAAVIAAILLIPCTGFLSLLLLLVKEHYVSGFVTVEVSTPTVQLSDEQTYRDASMSAAVQYLLGETTLNDAAQTLEGARVAKSLATRVSEQVAMMAAADGLSEEAAAAAAGITRKTLRAAMGK